MKSEHTPIPDSELESDWLVLPRGRMKDEIKETRRLLRAVEDERTRDEGFYFMQKYLTACKGKEQP